MKILLTGSVAGILTLLTVASKAQGDVASTKATGDSPSAYVKISPTTLPTTAGGGKSKPSSIRADRDFRKKYSNVEDVTWYDLPTGFRARLVYNGTETWVDYDG